MVQMHWINQLKGLLEVFDTATWTILILIILVVSRIFKYISYTKAKLKNRNVFYDLVSASVDQSAGLFSDAELRTSPAFFLSFALIPLLLPYLGNLYKGDNITDLTVGPPLVRFDTFESLVENQFKTLVPPLEIPASLFMATRNILNVKTDYQQTSRHEVFPFLSTLLVDVWLNIPYSQWKRLKHLRDKMSTQMWWYLENSELPTLNYSNLGKLEVKEYMEKHISKCNKSAIIESEQSIFQTHALQKTTKKPVYIGKDILSETYDGYSFQGYFPSSTLLRPKYYFQSGIQEWWQKHFSWSIILDTNIKLSLLENHISMSKDVNQIYSLCLIPLVGMVLATIVFFIVERSVCGLIFQKFKTVVIVFHMVKRSTLIALNFNSDYS